MADLKRSYHFFGSDPVEAAADGAAALRAIGSATKNAGFDAALEIGGIIGGHFREQAVVGIFRRAKQSLGHTRLEEKFWIFLVKNRQFASEGFAIGRQECLGALFPDLRRVNADPDAIDFRARAPERGILFKVAGAFEHRARNRPMDIDLEAFDIFQDALVGSRLAANIVMLGKAVDRDSDADPPELHPLDGNGNHSARDYQRENVHTAKNRENAAEFLVTDEWFAADQRNVDRLVLADEIDDAIDESIAAKIVELAKRGFAAEMRVTVSVTARTGERTFTSDFDREHGDFASENISPGGQNFALGDTRIRSGRWHGPHYDANGSEKFQRLLVRIPEN